MLLSLNQFSVIVFTSHQSPLSSLILPFFRVKSQLLSLPFFMKLLNWLNDNICLLILFSYLQFKFIPIQLTMIKPMFEIAQDLVDSNNIRLQVEQENCNFQNHPSFIVFFGNHFIFQSWKYGLEKLHISFSSWWINVPSFYLFTIWRDLLILKLISHAYNSSWIEWKIFPKVKLPCPSENSRPIAWHILSSSW